MSMSSRVAPEIQHAVAFTAAAETGRRRQRGSCPDGAARWPAGSSARRHSARPRGIRPASAGLFRRAYDVRPRGVFGGPAVRVRSTSSRRTSSTVRRVSSAPSSPPRRPPPEWTLPIESWPPRPSRGRDRDRPRCAHGVSRARGLAPDPMSGRTQTSVGADHRACAVAPSARMGRRCHWDATPRPARIASASAS
jgi:hypothetical protein